MKKLLILLVFTSLILSCKDKKVVDKKDDFLNVPSYIDDKTSDNLSSSYWYVTFDEVGAKETYQWHLAIKLNTSYFDFVEARKALPSEVVGNCYFDNFIKINRDTYESFVKYKKENFE